MPATTESAKKYQTIEFGAHLHTTPDTWEEKIKASVEMLLIGLFPLLLAFYAQDDDFFIKLNYAANMKAYETEKNTFDEVNEINPNILSTVDDPKGRRDGLSLDFEII